MAAAGERRASVKPQSREIDAQTRSLFGLSDFCSVSSVRAVIFVQLCRYHQSQEMILSVDISSTFKVSALRKWFEPLSLSVVVGMNQSSLDSLIDQIYRALSSTGVTQTERLHIVGYFCTLCGVASLADTFVECRIMSLFVKICQKPSNLPSLLCNRRTLAKLFRHARYISVAISVSKG